MDKIEVKYIADDTKGGGAYKVNVRKIDGRIMLNHGARGLSFRVDDDVNESDVEKKVAGLTGSDEAYLGENGGQTEK